MGETKFAEGFIAKAPNAKAPEYVKARLSIARKDAIAWLQSLHDDWVSVEIKESKNGKWYCAVDTWKPSSGQRAAADGGQRTQRQAQPEPAVDDFDDSGIPF